MIAFFIITGVLCFVVPILFEVRRVNKHNRKVLFKREVIKKAGPLWEHLSEVERARLLGAAWVATNGGRKTL